MTIRFRQVACLRDHRGVSPEHLPAYLDEFVSATAAAAPWWPRSRRFSAWGPFMLRAPIGRSPETRIRQQPESTG